MSAVLSELKLVGVVEECRSVNEIDVVVSSAPSLQIAFHHYRTAVEILFIESEIRSGDHIVGNIRILFTDYLVESEVVRCKTFGAGAVVIVVRNENSDIKLLVSKIVSTYRYNP